MKNEKDEKGKTAKTASDETGLSRRAALSAAAAVLTAPALSAAVSSASAAEPANFDAVASIKERIANLNLRGAPSLGIESDQGVIDVAATARALNISVPRDMDDLLQNGRGRDLLVLLEALKKNPTAAAVIPASQAVFAPLVTRPEKILCIGFNYRKHAEETGTPVPKAPPIFCKFNNALNHHLGRIKLPVHADTWFDYETELVIVFGKTCKDVSEGDALNYVAGYATGHDFSARGLQNITSQFTAGKTNDGFGPIGPWLGTRARIPDPNNLKLKTVVNGQVRQDWTTKDMIYNCRHLISYASRAMTIKPGDVMFTGTPQGVIWGQKGPQEKKSWLKAGDTVTSTLEGLGDLTVTLV